MFKLIAQNGTEYPLTGPVTTIGREGCDISLLQDDLVSRRHAKVERRGDQLVIVDLDSTNGTFVNGARIRAPHTLQPGDTIRIGSSSLTVYAEGSAGPTRLFSEPPTRVAPAPQHPDYGAPVPGAPAGYARPPKDRSLAIILEILPGFFAFLGIGWIYAGQTSTGVIILVADFVCNLIFAVIGALTAGFSLCLTIPIQIAAIAVSTYLLYQHTKERPEIFGP